MSSDVALGILQAAIALAGLLLVFIGFVFAKADGTGNKLPRQRVKRIAVLGLIPFLAALICSWQSVWALQGARISGLYLYGTFKIVITLTGLYAILATLLQVPEGRR